MAGAIRAGAAYVEITHDDTKLQRGLRRTQARLKAFGAAAAQMGQSMMIAAAAAAAPLVISIRKWASFSDKMLEVRAVSGATGEAFEKLEAQAKELGRTTSFMAQEVAAGMAEMGRAGFEATQIIAAMPSVLNLARGTATELAEAAQIGAATMRGFGLAASDMTRVADVLTIGANKSAQTLTELGESMKYVAPLAAEANETLEDTTAALMVLANVGIKGSMAGTALARAFKNLAREQTHKVLAAVGVAAVNASGDLRKVADIVGDIGQATAEMGTAKRLAIFEELFGRGAAAAAKLSHAVDFKDMRKELASAAGAAERTAEIMDSGLGGAFRKLMSAVEGVMLAVGEELAPMLTRWADQVKEIAAEVTKFAEEHGELLETITKSVVAIGALGVALTTLGITVKLLAVGFGGLTIAIHATTVAMAGLKAGATFMGMAMGGWPVLIAAAGVAALAFAAKWAFASKEINMNTEAMMSGFSGLEAELYKIAKAAGKVGDALRWDLKDLFAPGLAGPRPMTEDDLALFAKQDRLAAKMAKEERVELFIQMPKIEAFLRDVLAKKPPGLEEAEYLVPVVETVIPKFADIEETMKTVEARGTFSGFALQGMGLGSQVQDRTAQATEATAEYTKKIQELLEAAELTPEFE